VPDYSVAGGVPAVILKQYDFTREVWLTASSGAASQVRES